MPTTAASLGAWAGIATIKPTFRTLGAPQQLIGLIDEYMTVLYAGMPSGALLMCGEPIGEPIAMGGGFVMNHPEEIEAAFADYRGGRIGQLAASR